MAACQSPSTLFPYGMADGLKVIILGAGCSKSCGYPLAFETREHLGTFARSLEEEPRKVDSPRLLRLVNQTLEVFDRLDEAQGSKVNTLDELSWLVFSDKLLKAETSSGERWRQLDQKWRLVGEARLLARERRVRQYSSFWAGDHFPAGPEGGGRGARSLVLCAFAISIGQGLLVSGPTPTFSA